uniref:Uncharacterized protein n=1 Tax=Anguilla anguilla TaxID=7936 RepID=A0A0E9QWF0_ANGAN
MCCPQAGKGKKLLLQLNISTLKHVTYKCTCTLTEWEKYVEVTLTQGQMVIEILLLIYTARGRFQYA